MGKTHVLCTNFRKSKLYKKEVVFTLRSAIVDIHATLFIVFAYNLTSITSVMLLEDFTIPSAFLLSVFFLKIKYSNTHKLALILCVIGMSFSISNDVFVKEKENSDD